MRKLIKISALVIATILLLSAIFAGNYFYSESVKRGVEVELHKEATAVNSKAAAEDQTLLAEAKTWFEEQEPDVLELTSYDDLQLKAQFIENEQSTGRAVILAHGYRKESNDMGDLAKLYYDQGFDILMPDARGHGKSEGDYIGYGWHDRLDYKKWIDLLIEEYGVTNIFLHGNSMGASLVLMTSGEELPGEVKGIIADSGYTTVKEELTHQLKHLYNLPAFPLLDITSGITKIRAGYTFGEASAVEQVKKNTRPLLIIHGDKDELVPLEMAHELYHAAGGEKEIWIVPDAGHIKAYKNVTEQYHERLIGFIKKILE